MATDEKPSRNEDEYFVRLDQERMKELRAKLDADRQKAERSTSLGKCPRCGAALQEREHLHVRVDECPDCGGVWLDKNELDIFEHVDRNSVRRYVADLFGIKY